MSDQPVIEITEAMIQAGVDAMNEPMRDSVKDDVVAILVAALKTAGFNITRVSQGTWPWE